MDRNFSDRKKRSDATGRRHRRWLTSLALFVAVGLVSLPVILLAVHGQAFQLEGDVISATTTNIGGTTQLVDWDAIFNADGTKKMTLPAGFTAAGFSKDFNNNGNTFLTTDMTTFATGSKDTLPIIPGWQCNFDNNVNNKIDIMNAYAAAFTDPTNNDQIIYFGLERNTNTGDANVGFWFLQDDVGCSSAGGAVAFTGSHMDGDLLIVSAFTNGGSVSTIDVYRWNGGANGSLGATPVAHGVDCRDPLTTAGDTACAVANSTANGTGGTIGTPWLTANFKDGVGHSLRTAEFFEGGLNLTKSNLGGKCFNVFIGDTRSSQSLTATLFDYARGVIGECGSTTVTTPSIASATLPTDPTDASVDVSDSASVNVNGLSNGTAWSGTLAFHLCGPFAFGTTTTCGTGGVLIDSAVSVSGTTPTAGVASSSTAKVTSAGRYCWRADFTGTSPAGIFPSSDSSITECFVINPVQPSVSTQASGTVPLGQKISDTVNLSGTAHKPGTGGPAGSNGSINPATLGGDATGDITVTVYGPNSCSMVAFGPLNITASGDGSYGGADTAFEVTPTAAGVYVFVAQYAGDSPNTLKVDPIDCASQPDNEKVTVEQIPTGVKTKQGWYPQDTATVKAKSGNLNADGKLKFELFMSATCEGAAQYSEELTVAGGAPSRELSTSNTTFFISTGYADAAGSTTGAYGWKVTYTPAAADTGHTGSTSQCETFNITYTNDKGPLEIFP